MKIPSAGTSPVAKSSVRRMIQFLSTPGTEPAPPKATNSSGVSVKGPWVATTFTLPLPFSSKTLDTLVRGAAAPGTCVAGGPPSGSPLKVRS